MTQAFIKTGVIGHPIAHSKSPLIHNYWIKHYGLSGEYKAIDIAPQDLKSGVQSLVNQGYAGFNVTIPHKIAIMDLCDEMDEAARLIGAVNTVVIKDGKLYGSNTDGYGFITNIKANAPEGWSLAGGNALVLGAGGAANAVVYALIQEGAARITITNRTREKAEALVKLSPERIDVIDWDERSSACADKSLIVNTTALGMSGKAALDIDLSSAGKDTLVSDIVYAPLTTNLLNQAHEIDIPTVTGIGMLLHQARPGFELWNGVMPEVTAELERLVLA